MVKWLYLHRKRLLVLVVLVGAFMALGAVHPGASRGPTAAPLRHGFKCRYLGRSAWERDRQRWPHLSTGQLYKMTHVCRPQPWAYG